MVSHIQYIILLVVCVVDVILNWILQDLKSDKARAQMGAARAILEKSTMMLLTTSKVSSKTYTTRDNIISLMLFIYKKLLSTCICSLIL